MFAVGISCHKDNQHNNKGILIKGTINGGTKGESSKDYPSKSASLTAATRVLVIYGDQSFISDIKDGSISINVPMGSATALIFVDANNQYIGNLSVSGLNILPLVNLSDGANTVIDLSSLTLAGTSVIPSNNPIGSQIMLSSADVAIQFHNNTGLLYQEGSLFDLMNVLPDFNNVTISKDVNINSVTGMDICYIDLVGNMYALTWRKP